MKDKNKTEKGETKENLSAYGQMILGEIETVGGVLTGDPITRSEGNFNVEVGAIHQESNEDLHNSNRDKADGED